MVENYKSARVPAAGSLGTLISELLLNFSQFRCCFRQLHHFQVRKDWPVLHLVEEELLTWSQTGTFSTAERVCSAFPLRSSVGLFPGNALIHSCWGSCRLRCSSSLAVQHVSSSQHGGKFALDLLAWHCSEDLSAASPRIRTNPQPRRAVGFHPLLKSVATADCWVRCTPHPSP